MAGELPFEKPLVEMRQKINELKQFGADKGIDFSDEIARLEERYAQLEEEVYSNITAAQKMHLARHHQRPTSLDLIQLIGYEGQHCPFLRQRASGRLSQSAAADASGGQI
nr:hypothetical protein [Paenibacillus sp. AR247]